jgi:hypothetical protein
MWVDVVQSLVVRADGDAQRCCPRSECGGERELGSGDDARRDDGRPDGGLRAERRFALTVFGALPQRSCSRRSAAGVIAISRKAPREIGLRAAQGYAGADSRKSCGGA